MHAHAAAWSYNGSSSFHVHGCVMTIASKPCMQVPVCTAWWHGSLLLWLFIPSFLEGHMTCIMQAVHCKNDIVNVTGNR